MVQVRGIYFIINTLSMVIISFILLTCVLKEKLDAAAASDDQMLYIFNWLHNDLPVINQTQFKIYT